MKLLHIADLYLDRWGTQRLDWLTDIAIEEQADAVLLAGGIWYAPAPAVESVMPFCTFVRRLTARGIRVFAVGSSRDAALTQLPPMDGFTCACRFTGAVETVALEDEHGAVLLHLLPTLPTEEQFISVLSSTPLPMGVRNILLSGQVLQTALVTAFDYLAMGGDSEVTVVKLGAQGEVETHQILLTD